MIFDALQPRLVCEKLAVAGLRLAPERIRIERREERWVAHLPEDRLAWFPASEEGRRRLVTERRVLRLLEARCSFGAPRIIFEHPEGDFDVRSMVPGASDAWRVFRELREKPELAARVGAAVGAILAEQHTRIVAADVSDWLPRRPSWPQSREWIRERLVRVVDDPELIADIEAVMAKYEVTPVIEADRALVHSDVGFHNLGIDPTSYAVHGIFDYDDASWSDRHHDFRYLMFDLDRFDLLEAALSVYEPVVGRTISRGRVVLYNAASAITFLAHRAGTRPDERPCGRTLAEDLGWTRYAIAKTLALKPSDL
jgi:Phosphotransferase enzyme family